MESLKGLGQKVKEKAGSGMLGVIEKMLEDIDAFDQLAELVKSVVPLKAEVTVKGKKTLEVKALIKNDQLWIGIRRLKEPPKPSEPEEKETTEEIEKE